MCSIIGDYLEKREARSLRELDSSDNCRMPVSGDYLRARAIPNFRHVPTGFIAFINKQREHSRPRFPINHGPPTLNHRPLSRPVVARLKWNFGNDSDCILGQSSIPTQIIALMMRHCQVRKSKLVLVLA